MTTYTCKLCSAPATVVDGKVVTTCNCNAGIIANLKATVYGESHTGTKKAD